MLTRNAEVNKTEVNLDIKELIGLVSLSGNAISSLGPDHAWEPGARRSRSVSRDQCCGPVRCRRHRKMKDTQQSKFDWAWRSSF